MHKDIIVQCDYSQKRYGDIMLKFCVENEAHELENDNLFLPQRPSYHCLISKVYKCKIFYAKQFINDELTHILPFALISNTFLGKKIVSMPFDGSFGGVIELKKCKIYDGLYNELIQFAQTNKVNYIELRHRAENRQLNQLGFTENVSLIISEVDLKDICTNKKYIRKKKKNSKLANKYGVGISISDDPEDMKTFYKIMSLNMRSYGTPMYPYKYFEQIWSHYYSQGNMKLIKGTYKGEMVSGLLLLISGKTAVIKDSAKIHQYISKRLYPSMKWYAMDLCWQRKCEILNMGTAFVDDYGLISAKEGLGAKTIPLVTYSFNILGKNKPLSDYQRKFKFFIRVWKYQPLQLSQWLGGVFWKWFC